MAIPNDVPEVPVANTSHLTPDIQTGRNVYVDQALFRSDEKYKERIKSMVDEGFYPLCDTPEKAFLNMLNDDIPAS